MLALALMGLLPPGAHVSGEAFFSGANGAAGSRANLLTLGERERIGVRGRDIAMIFQEPMTALNPVMRVGAQISEAIRAHHAGLSRELRDWNTRVVGTFQSEDTAYKAAAHIARQGVDLPARRGRKVASDRVRAVAGIRYRTARCTHSSCSVAAPILSFEPSIPLYALLLQTPTQTPKGNEKNTM